jgi:hypothetical protein
LGLLRTTAVDGACPKERFGGYLGGQLLSPALVLRHVCGLIRTPQFPAVTPIARLKSWQTPPELVLRIVRAPASVGQVPSTALVLR